MNCNLKSSMQRFFRTSRSLLKILFAYFVDIFLWGCGRSKLPNKSIIFSNESGNFRSFLCLQTLKRVVVKINVYRSVVTCNFKWTGRPNSLLWSFNQIEVWPILILYSRIVSVKKTYQQLRLVLYPSWWLKPARISYLCSVY